MNWKELVLLCWYEPWIAALACINAYVVICFVVALFENKKEGENNEINRGD